MTYTKTNNLEKSLETVNEALKFDSEYELTLCFRAEMNIIGKLSQWKES